MIIEYTKKYSKSVYSIYNYPLSKTGRIVEMLMASPYTLTITVKWQ